MRVGARISAAVIQNKLFWVRFKAVAESLETAPCGILKYLRFIRVAGEVCSSY
jgi:hypothetical protein